MNRRNRLSGKESVIIFLLALFASAAVLALCSVTTSPLFEDCYTEFNNNLSVSAQLIGKAFLEGSIPYRDLCGTEGPLYYLIQALGYLLGGRTGLYILQVVSLTVSLGVLYRTTRRFLNIPVSFCVMLLILYAVAAAIGSGNSSMEFSLPIFSFLYMILIDISSGNGDETHVCVRTAFLSGIGMAGLLLLTFHNVIPVILMAAAFFYLSGGRKRGKTILLFIAGFSVLAVPAVLILLKTGALSYYIYDGILFHFEALKVGNDTANEMIRKAIKNIPFALICLFAALNRNADMKKINRTMAFISLVLFCTMLAGYGYWHYYIVMIPFISYGFITTLTSGRIILKKMQAVLFPAVIVLLYLTPFKNNLTAVVNDCMSREYEYNNLAACQWYEDFITEDKTIIAVDVSAAFYLVNDFLPDYRMFADQTWLSRVDSRYSAEIQEEVGEGWHNYLLVGSVGFVSESYGDYELTDLISLYRMTYLYINTEMEES